MDFDAPLVSRSQQQLANPIINTKQTRTQHIIAFHTGGAHFSSCQRAKDPPEAVMAKPTPRPRSSTRSLRSHGKKEEISDDPLRHKKKKQPTRMENAV
jgi:hypothetical protein